MVGSDWAAIAVGVISVIAAIFSGRAAQRAAKISTDAGVSTQKIMAETEAYNRARAMDTETIKFQGAKITGLMEDNERILRAIRQLREENQMLHEDNDRLRRKVAGLEQKLQGEVPSE
jgi:predicted RNase H-like nuclease (RuvC/YqgF family)